MTSLPVGAALAGEGGTRRSQVLSRCHSSLTCSPFSPPPFLSASLPAPLAVQVNIGILIAVTRVISQISADNYKVHRDPSAFKYVGPGLAGSAPHGGRLGQRSGEVHPGSRCSQTPNTPNHRPGGGGGLLPGNWGPGKQGAGASSGR